MTYFVCFLLIASIYGLVAVASNPAPYFAIFGLVIVSGVGCGVLSYHGGSFLSLILFLIYLGGMLVVFVYSSALAADPYPESWDNYSVAGAVVMFFVGISSLIYLFFEEWYEGSWVVVDVLKEFIVVRGDVEGVALVYSLGGVILVVCAWVLLLTLFAVLELTRGKSRGTLRAV
uniref:NADH-ubiquinone oxidoreductase chain 6 n=1 Tax=Paedocypris micromegethes TaxID=1093616 RepID=A0A7L8EZF7_9TELE|nr:NADH dehydrogenase subunit 6 [Paedocypris micromegethes]QOE17693.1 NADH dehydrogenase subunit 6 [Paedocypris micromegethes]